MKKKLCLIFSLLFLFSVTGNKVYGQTPPKNSVTPAEIIVVFNSPPTASTLLSLTGINRSLMTKQAISGTNAMVFEVSEVSINDKIAELLANPQVQSAFPNIRLQLLSLTNDPGLSLQWNLINTKFTDTGRSAWDVTQGSTDVAVAVIDSGLDSNHEDLQGKIVSPTNCNNDSGCIATSNMTDDDTHGTHVSGIVAAATNNGKGIAGAAYNVKVMPIKVTRGNVAEGMNLSDIVNAIRYAADRNAAVINLSLGVAADNIDTDQLTMLNEAISYAFNKGAVIVAAAGNCGGGLDTHTPPDADNNPTDDCDEVDINGKFVRHLVNPKFYPAFSPNVISVAALNRNNAIASYSERNDSSDPQIGNWISVAAPGGECTSVDDAQNCILSTYVFPFNYECSATVGTLDRTKYCYMAGTSQAAPLVSSIAALMLSVNPALSTTQVRSMIESSANHSIASNYTNFGLVNALTAVEAAEAASLVSPTPTPTLPVTLTPTLTPTSGPTVSPTLTPTILTPTPTPAIRPTDVPRLPRTAPDPYPTGPYCPAG